MESLAAHERFLWGLCYRLTGSAADADDLVQETFARALASPPARTDDLRPWLVRVAQNLARDAYRRRRRRGYDGTWLPTPVDTDALAFDVMPEPMSAEARYGARESAGLAFLVALEALTPRERAVLVLRDVLDYSVREAAGALDMSEGAVKTTHHRARRAMDDYDATRSSQAALEPRTMEAIARFMTALVAEDAAGVEAALTESVRVVSDGAGEFHAAKRPVVGAAKVALFFRKLTARRQDIRVEIRSVNGLPALIGESDSAPRGDPPRFVLTFDLAPDGRIRGILSFLATAKLARIARVAR